MYSLERRGIVPFGRGHAAKFATSNLSGTSKCYTDRCRQLRGFRGRRCRTETESFCVGRDASSCRWTDCTATHSHKYTPPTHSCSYGRLHHTRVTWCKRQQPCSIVASKFKLSLRCLTEMSALRSILHWERKHVKSRKINCKDIQKVAFDV